MATVKLQAPHHGAAKPLVKPPSSPMHDAKPPHQLLHNPGISVEWTAEEQSILEDNLLKFANEPNLWKYIKIAALFSDKTVRDVALRCKWMSKRDMSKRRKLDEPSRKLKDSKKEKPRSGASMYNTPPLPIDNDDGISNDAIGGTAGELFEQNLQVIIRIRANLVACKAQENTELFARFRDNLYSIQNGMTNVPGIMGLMPQLPVAINTELADSIFPKRALQHS